MNLSQLIAAVYTETNRPDLVAETLQAVLEATMSVHVSDNYMRDLVEAPVVFLTANYLQTLDTSTIALFRQVSYIRKTVSSAQFYENNPGQPSPVSIGPRALDFLSFITPDDIFDPYGYEKTDVCYQAGTAFVIKSSTPLQYAILGYYKFPQFDPTGATYGSWIAGAFPYVIIYRAAGTLFAKIGEDKSASMYMRPPNGSPMDEGGLYYSQLKLLKQSQILSQAW